MPTPFKAGPIEGVIVESVSHQLRRRAHQLARRLEVPDIPTSQRSLGAVEFLGRHGVFVPNGREFRKHVNHGISRRVGLHAGLT